MGRKYIYMDEEWWPKTALNLHEHGEGKEEDKRGTRMRVLKSVQVLSYIIRE
jgi:hypothetical protein